jgi:hypothetical protein
MTKDAILDLFIRGNDSLSESATDNKDISGSLLMRKLCEGSFMIKTGISPNEHAWEGSGSKRYASKYSAVLLKKILDQDDEQLLMVFLNVHLKFGLNLHPLALYEMNKLKFKIELDIKKMQYFIKSSGGASKGRNDKDGSQKQQIKPKALPLKDLQAMNNVFSRNSSLLKQDVLIILKEQSPNHLEKYFTSCIKAESHVILNLIFQLFKTDHDDAIWKQVSFKQVLAELPAKHFFNLPDFWLKNGLIFDRRESLAQWLELTEKTWPQEFCKTYLGILSILLKEEENQDGSLLCEWLLKGAYHLEPQEAFVNFIKAQSKHVDDATRKNFEKTLHIIELRKEIINTLNLSSK